MDWHLLRRNFVGFLAIAVITACQTTQTPATTGGAQRGAQADRPPPKEYSVVFVTGDDEYRSEITMPFVAGLLGRGRGREFRLIPTVLYAVGGPYDQRDPKAQESIEGLEALETADLVVFFLRFRALPDRQLEYILDYVNSGKPIIGLRTSTHAFRYPPENPNANYNDDFGREVFGQSWITHHGNKSTTDVWPSPVPPRT